MGAVGRSLAIRRAIIAVPFAAAVGLAVRLDRGPVRPRAAAARPGFALRDQTAAAGIHFVHRRPTFDRKIANVEPHLPAPRPPGAPRAPRAGLADLNRPAEGVSMGSVWGDFDNDGREDLLVYRYGYLALFRNLDGRRFEDVTGAAG